LLARVFIWPNFCLKKCASKIYDAIMQVCPPLWQWQWWQRQQQSPKGYRRDNDDDNKGRCRCRCQCPTAAAAAEAAAAAAAAQWQEVGRITVQGRPRHWHWLRRQEAKAWQRRQQQSRQHCSHSRQVRWGPWQGGTSPPPPPLPPRTIDSYGGACTGGSCRQARCGAKAQQTRVSVKSP
jgi:hypothetical protein